MDRAIKILRWTGRIIACLASAYVLLFAIAGLVWGRDSLSTFSIEAYSQGFLVSTLTLKMVVRVFIILGIVLGLFLAWWEDLPAGLCYFTLSALIVEAYQPHIFLEAWLVLGMPFAVAGSLFIAAWLLSLKHGELKKGASPAC